MQDSKLASYHLIFTFILQSAHFITARFIENQPEALTLKYLNATM